MSMKIIFRMMGILLLASLAAITMAQGPAGYTKVASVTTTTYTDTAVSAGQVWNYTVTATNAAGESGPSNVVSGTIPSGTGTHSVTLSWTASATDSTHSAATGYNVYRQQVTPPNQPGAVSLTVQ